MAFPQSKIFIPDWDTFFKREWLKRYKSVSRSTFMRQNADSAVSMHMALELYLPYFFFAICFPSILFVFAGSQCPFSDYTTK